MLRARARICSSRRPIMRGVKPRLMRPRSLRCARPSAETSATPCQLGSKRRSAGPSSAEKVSSSRATRRTRSIVETTQNPRSPTDSRTPGVSGWRQTGASRRSLAKSACGKPARKSERSERSTPSRVMSELRQSGLCAAAKPCDYTPMRSIALSFAAALLAGAPASASDYDAAARSARSLLDALVAADTSNPPGNESRAAALGAERLEAAGIPSERTSFAPGRENLVARLRGDGSLPPLLLLAHTDVVGAEGQKWSSNPHVVTEKDGYLVGRGVEDDLSMAALALEVLVMLQREKTPLTRDVILAWTGDEESGGGGIRWLLEHQPGSVKAAFAFNEGGMIRLGEGGKPTWAELQTAEKSYQDYVLVAHGETGHSSVPLPDNAIYRLSRGLAKLAEYRFPARLLPVTRAYFLARAPLEPPAQGRAMRAIAAAKGPLPKDALAVLDADPVVASTLRTTCVATLLSGGTRVNALPAEARASVNCRILPDETPAQVQATLARVLADPGIEITPPEERSVGEPSPLEGPAPAAIAAVVAQMYPGLPVVPFMSRGATDSRFLRAHGIPAYGISPFLETDEDARRAHGVDERIPAASLRTGIEFLHRLVLELAERKPGPPARATRTSER